MPYTSVVGRAIPGKATPGWGSEVAFVVSGQISIDATGAITIVSSEIEGSVVSGQISVGGTADITVVSSLREAISGALSVSGVGDITIVSAVTEIVSGALSVAGVASITIVSASINADGMLRVVLTATYHARASGAAARGKVHFRLADEIRDAAGNITAARVRHRANLSDGAFTISLPVATGGVDYVVVEEIGGAEKRQFTVTIPATPATQTLAEVI